MRLRSIVDTTGSVPFSNNGMVIDDSRVCSVLSRVRSTVPTRMERTGGVITSEGRVLTRTGHRSRGVVEDTRRHGGTVLGRGRLIHRTRTGTGRVISSTGRGSTRVEGTTGICISDVVGHARRNITARLRTLEGARTGVIDSRGGRN